MDLWDRIWKDKRGHVVIWQMPNAYLIAWAVLTVISLFFSSRSRIGDIFSGAGAVVLIVWGALELFKGVNYFRRALGLIVLILAAMSLIKSL